MVNRKRILKKAFECGCKKLGRRCQTHGSPQVHPSKRAHSHHESLSKVSRSSYGTKPVDGEERVVYDRGQQVHRRRPTQNKYDSTHGQSYMNSLRQAGAGDSNTEELIRRSQEMRRKYRP